MTVHDDQSMTYDYGHIWLDANYAQGLLEDGTSKVQTSLGAGTPVRSELSVAAAELTGVAVDSADELYWLELLERHPIDRTRDIQAAVVWDGGAVGNRTGVVWKVFAKGFNIGFYKDSATPESVSDVLVSPDASLTYAAFTVPASPASPFCITPWKSLLIAGNYTYDSLLGVVCELDDRGQAAADEMKLLGVLLRYTRGLCSVDGRKKLT